MKRLSIFFFIIFSFFACKKGSIGIISPYVYPPNTYAHDPTIIKQDSMYYVFYTGDGIQMIASKNMLDWSSPKQVFMAPPTWMTQKVPGFDNSIWAPDISYYNGQYYLFYTISQFATNNSAIGLVTNVTLDSTSINYKWVDHGRIIESINDISPWNAIDPNLVTDNSGDPWLVFGSFYNGIHIVKLSQDRLSVQQDTSNLPVLASRSDTYADWNPANGPGGNNIEGSFIYKHDNYFYLFASVDVCCKGVNSTYKIIVGRSTNVNGPYVDNLNRNMTNGGQLLMLESDNNWHGVGGESVYHMNNADYMVFHAYDVHDNGVAKLRIEPISWDADDWPHIQNAY